MPAKKRPAAADSAAIPTVPAASPVVTPDAQAPASPAPAPKKPAAKRVAKAGGAATPEAPPTPRRAPSKARRSTPPVIADPPTPDATELRVAADVTSATTAPPDAAAPRSRPTEDEIRQYAYFLSLRRHGRGDPIADWMEAERALLARTE